MSLCADTARLAPDERLREIASILATAVLRLRQRAALPPAENVENPVSAGLAIPPETRLSVRVG